MRLLLVNHEFTITGASMVLFRLATYFREAGHEVHIFPVNPEDGPMKTRYEAAGIPVLASVVPREYDLALCNGICAAGQVQQIAPNVPVIWLVHEAEVALNLLLQHHQMIPAFAAASAIVYQSPYQAEVLRSFTYQLDPRKFHIIPNGVEVSEELPLARVPPKRRAFRVVQVASVEPRKRPGDLIRAVARSGLDAECIFCGRFYGLDDEALALAEAAPEQFRFTGEVEPVEALAWVLSADVFCLASGSETQGLAAYEAALLGRPLLLTDLPCYRDIFTHGRNCLVFPAGRADMLALTLAMYASSPELRAEMGEAAQRTARRFTNAAFYARFDALLTEVAALPRG
ncbi:glycosyltransferase family 4 protein [Acidocella aromatica]|uniref:Glycosyltransferase involved in cell wall biosynthesis n=1 Tax=Acidocella aromatica TaxID=1303579 RepID=A0A840VLY5_9PROT|nr:glycosyltransferase family 4 protein [Acidocella aromatica]MBB5373189.1 glycosyltransferase involved in cell wall biosynthesis [Acidocella aromatica]